MGFWLLSICQKHIQDYIFTKDRSDKEWIWNCKRKCCWNNKGQCTNMDVVMAELGFPDTSCFGHILQLAINSFESSRNTGLYYCLQECCDSLQSFYQINRRVWETSSRKAHSPTTRCAEHVGILHITWWSRYCQTEKAYIVYCTTKILQNQI